MSVDLRTRTVADAVDLNPAEWFGTTLPDALEKGRDLLEGRVSLLGLRPFGITVDGATYTLSLEGERVVVRDTGAGNTASLRISAARLSQMVNDEITPVTLFTGGELDMPSGNIADVFGWWLVLRSVLDERPVHTPGAIRFQGPNGGPFDFHRSFDSSSSPSEMSAFLHEAGFLHLKGVFDAGEMQQISRDMDAAAPTYSDGDAKSWWATTNDGKRRVVRMQSFDEHSDTTARLLDDDRFLRLAGIPGDGHYHAGLEGNRIEALFKPIGVVEGISDVPWHKDCSLGRHSYECCSMTAGISVTGGGPNTGQLRVIAGSHRALMWPAMIDPAKCDLPEIELPTEAGDVTLHLSCTLHMAEPPSERERRVMYTSFRLPGVMEGDEAGPRARIREVREGAHRTVSQAPSRARADEPE